ncbi:MAG: YibE/F family protein [Defluviitaleaceae bacterium]|nr:YibE/F family protein [Defluviitaleaceae bacterium]
MAKIKQAKKQKISLPNIPKPGDLLRSGRLWLGLAGIIFCIVIIYMSDFSALGLPPSFNVERARVISVLDTNIWPDHYIPSVYVGSQRVEIEILSGEFAGEQLEVINTLSRFANLYMRDGMEVLVSILPDIEYLEAHFMGIYGPSRGPVVIGSVGLLVVSMLIMGRKKGFFAALALGFTMVSVVFFLVSFLALGYSPVVFSLLTAIITTTFTLLMVSGFSRQSLAAVAGTWTGLVFAGLLSVLLGRLGNVSGLNLEDARQMLYNSPPDIFLRIPDMFFAGVIIAASGVVVDAAMSISSSVFEIKEQSPGITSKRLYRSGMHIGGDILGANSNTLILALTGASLPTMILIVLFGFPYLRVINLDFVAIEVIQSVSAAMGMIFAIPATALFSSLLATRNQ